MFGSFGRMVVVGLVLGPILPAAACAQARVGDGGGRMSDEARNEPRAPADAADAEAGSADIGGVRRVPGVFAGHHTLEGRPTGCTVVLVPDGAVGAVDVRGGAPGTRETDLLDPVNSVQRVHGIALSGGSAFGLETAAGVMRYLEELGAGFEAGPVRVPIVPAAILFDLGIGDPSIRPDAECGYRAARAATEATGPLAEGNVGAGAGATIGKIAGMDRAMKGGVGTASIELESGLVVAALVVVNALGDVVDPGTGRLVAGVRTEDGGGLADARTIVRDNGRAAGGPGSSTVLAVVATNAALSQAHATRVARMAHDGLARAIVPSHTPWDGDAVFTIATGDHGDDDPAVVGALAADAVARAILRGVRAAASLPGIPAASDIPAPGDGTPR